MKKTTIEIDESLLAEAQALLGTHGLKETVHRAFQELLAIEARRKSIKQLQEMDGLELDNPEVMRRAWR